MNSIFSSRLLRCVAVLTHLWLFSLTAVVAQNAADPEENLPSLSASPDPQEEVGDGTEEEHEDDTPDVDTDSTIDDVTAGKGWSISGDLRPIIDYLDRDGRNGIEFSEDSAGFRVRLGIVGAVTERWRFGARLAGVCFTTECDGEFILDSAIPESNGLAGGQVTFDELFLHWHRKERFDLAIGRLQTRFVLRGGVYAKSLDRNDSNNVNVTWTDGVHSTYRARNGWASHFVLQRNVADGTGSIRRGLLDFDDDSARNTYFFAVENTRRAGHVVQRGFDVSYLPDSLLKDGDPGGRREDYWGLVGRVSLRFPKRSDGPRLRAGVEIGYAPETPTEAASRLGISGDVDGLAWNVVASIMDFAPSHSIGINYGKTGAGWLLSPQFRPNEDLFEIRYQWRPEHFPLVEARIRWREDLDQLIGTVQKREVFDFYLRLTWEFKIKEF